MTADDETAKNECKSKEKELIRVSDGGTQSNKRSNHQQGHSIAIPLIAIGAVKENKTEIYEILTLTYYFQHKIMLITANPQ